MCMHVCLCETIGKDLHTAVRQGNGFRVTGHALLLTIVGAGGRSHSITSVDIVRVDGLPTGCMSGKMKKIRAFI